MDYCSSPKVLLLGISYPDVWGHMKAHSYDQDVLQNSELSVDQAVECVRRKILTEMDGRDLARCVATEHAGGGHEVYTVSKEMGGIYRNDRHVYASFNNSRGMRKAMAKAFGHVRFQQVILDYYWMPTGWLVTRWNKTLFQETLPDLVKYDMLAYPGIRSRSPKKKKHINDGRNNPHNKDNNYNYNLDLEEGVVFLPFCAHVCKELVGGIDKLKPYYAITFVKKSELPGHALWKGTMTIDGNDMQHRLGKRLDQEEIYCTFQPKDIYESMEDAHVNKDEVMQMLLSIEDFENIRMIRLRPLRQHEPPSVFRKVVVEPETGGFIGLNWAEGRKRFKEYKRRRKNKPPLPPPPSKSKSKIAKAKTARSRKVILVHDSDSDLHTDFSDSEDNPFDTESDSSSDEEEGTCNDEDAGERNKLKIFDPCDPDRIPQTTHYFPYPALDIESYMISKDVEEKDRVMAFYAKQWGPKCSRKKNKKQGIVKQDFRRFQKTQQDYLSYNPRMPIQESEHKEGYKWTLVGSDDEHDHESDSDDSTKTKRKRRSKPGWNLSLKGDDPYAHLEPKIVQLAKRDYETAASLHLFEMKNPGFKSFSRTWANNTSHKSCYKIPKESVLIKMDTAEKARKKREAEIAALRQLELQDGDYYSDNESTSFMKKLDKASKAASSELYRFANIAATAPILSDDYRLICEKSQGLVDERPRDMALPPFRPKGNSNQLPYNLAPHTDFPRELFRLLQEAEDRILDHIVCWQERGRSFVVKEHEAFEKIVLSHCCKDADATYQSFLTTIMSYGFVEIRVGKRKGGYRHNLFQRGKPKRLDRLIREGANNLFIGGNGDATPAVDGSIDESVVQERKSLSDISSRNIFIANLYQLLRKSHSLGLTDAIHWEKNGKSFKVYKLNENFTTRVLKDYLSMTRYRRFKSELVDRGFNCKEGKKYGVFEHPDFIRGQRGVSKTFEDVNLQRGNNENKNEQKPESSSDPSHPTLYTQSSTSRKRKPDIALDSVSCSESKPQESNTKKIQPKNGRKSVLTNGKRKIQPTNKRKSVSPNRSNQRKKEPLVSNRKEKQLKNGEKPVSVSDTSHPMVESQAPQSRRGTREPSKNFATKYDFSHKHRIPKVMSDILEDSINEGFSETIHWLPEGDSFFINKELFTKLLHEHSRIRFYSTFENHMKYLGFDITGCAEGGSIFKHKHFVRGQVVSAKEAQKLFRASRKRGRRTDSMPAKKASKKLKVTKIQSKKALKPASSEAKDSENTFPEVHNGDVIQTVSSSSESEKLHNSPEKENSHLHLGTAMAPTEDQNATGNYRDKTSAATGELAGLSTGQQMLPLSAVEAPKGKEPTKYSKSILTITADATTKATASKGSSKGRGRPKKPSRGRPKSGATQGGKAGNKKRKIVPNSPSKPTGRKKKSFILASDTSVSLHISRSHDKNAIKDPPSSPHKRNAAPVSGRGLRSSTKVCGINTMNSSKASSVSKCKPLGHKPHVLEILECSMKIATNSLSLPSSPDSFPAAGGDDGQIMMFNPSTFSGAQVSANSVAVTPPPPSNSAMAMPMDGRVVEERLRGIGLSVTALKNVLFLYTSSLGESRAKTLKAIIFWQAGIPVPLQSEIEQLSEWIPFISKPVNETSKLQYTFKRSLFIEVSALEISTVHGDDWYQHVSVLRAMHPLHSAAIGQLKLEVRDICNRNSSNVATVCQELMSLSMNHRIQELDQQLKEHQQVAINQRMRELRILEIATEERRLKEEERRLKDRLADIEVADWMKRQQNEIVVLRNRQSELRQQEITHLVRRQSETQKQELYFSHGGIANGNNGESTIHALNQCPTQGRSNEPASTEHHQNTNDLSPDMINYLQNKQNHGLPGSGTTTRNRTNTIAAGSTIDHRNFYNNNSTRTSVMQQLCLHDTHQRQQSSLGYETYFQH